MSKLLNISIVVLILILIIGGYKYYQTSQAQDLLLANMKANIGRAMYHLDDALNKFSELDTTELYYHQFGKLYKQIGIAQNETRLLASSSLKNKGESVWYVMMRWWFFINKCKPKKRQNPYL